MRARKTSRFQMLSYRKSASKVTEVTQRFNSSSDKLKFLIVTSMLCTGFDAPIEGVMYLDKPMRNHTLYQTMCRVNRKWESKDPERPSRKEHGLVVDYFGLGEKIAQAMLPVDPNVEMLSQLNKDELLHEFSLYLGVCLRYFKDIPRTKNNIHTAELHLERTKNKEPFQINFGVTIEIWKKLFPHALLKQCAAEMIWLSEVYAKCSPSNGRDEFITALTQEAVTLMHNNMFNVIIDPSKYSGLLLDADAVHALHTGAVFMPDDFYDSPDTIDDAVRKAMEKLRKLVEKRHERSPYIELIEYLDEIYEMYINRIVNAAETLHSALGVMDEAEALRVSEDVSDDSVEAAVERIMLALAPSLSEDARLEICVQVETAIEDILESTEPTHMEVIDMWGQSLMDHIGSCIHSSGLPVIMSDYVAKTVRRRSHDRGELVARITYGERSGALI
jgi:type I restriction enzyme R subunit